MLTQNQLAYVWRPPCTGPFVTVYPPGEGRWQVRASAREAFEALAQTMRAFGYKSRYADTGAGVCRHKVGRPGEWSNHAYWTAADTNWQSGPYGTRRTDRPPGLNQAIVAIRTNNGKQVFNNGIFWRTPDPMHDEIVCSPQDLAHGINWATVPGGRPGGTPPPTAKPPPPKPEPAPPETPEPPDITEDTMFILRIDADHPLKGTTWEFFESARKGEPPVRRMIPKAGNRANLMFALNVAKGGQPVIIFNTAASIEMLNVSFERWIDATPSGDYFADNMGEAARRQQAQGL
jgi:hypothetical protein